MLHERDSSWIAHMPLSLANKITSFRIICVPFFILLLIYYDRSVQQGVINSGLRIAASLVFIITFLADAVDGYIARSRKQVSRLGTIIDPLADKALLLSALIVLCYSSEKAFSIHMPIWFVWLVISRDTMLIVGAIVIHVINGSVQINTRVSGKTTTFFQMVLIIWVLLFLPKAIFNWLIWSASIFTGVSAAQYFYDGIKQFERV